MQTKRSTLRLPPDAHDALEWLVEERQVKTSEAVRRALFTEKALMEVAKMHGRVMVEIPGQPSIELKLI